MIQAAHETDYAHGGVKRALLFQIIMQDFAIAASSNSLELPKPARKKRLIATDIIAINKQYDFRSCFDRIEIICAVLHHALAL